MTSKVVDPNSQIEIVFSPKPTVTSPENQPTRSKWTRGVCPNCNYSRADVDPDGIVWCPACGYSQKGCYT